MDDICDNHSFCQFHTILSAGGWACFLVFLDPQEAHLGAKVESVSDAGEEGFGVTRSAGRHTGPVCHCVIMDVLWQDPTLLEENSGVENLFFDLLSCI